MHWIQRIAKPIALLACITLTGCESLSEVRIAEVVATAGVFNVDARRASTHSAGMAGAAVILDPNWKHLHPEFGVLATKDSDVYVWGGLRYFWDLSDRWYLAPHTAVGLYEPEGGADLGGPVEFRSGLELGYRFSPNVRLGIDYSHLSNSRIYDRNPGLEDLVFNLGFSLPAR